MARRTSCYERLVFPAWSDGGSTVTPKHTRRHRRRRLSNGLHLLLAVFFAIAIISFITYIVPRRGSDNMLNARLSPEDERLLRPPRLPATVGNPWRGAGRRMRSDLVIAVSGCGGTFRPALQSGMRARVRYVQRKASGALVDSSSDAVHIVLGAHHVPDVEHALAGLCAGEVVRVLRGSDTLLVAVLQVGNDIQRDGRDIAARAIVARTTARGRSCQEACRKVGLICEASMFAVVNNCPRMRMAFRCTRCEVAAVGSAGADMPAWVSYSAPAGHARGACLVSPDVTLSCCEASFAHTRRLCPCFKPGQLLKLLAEAETLR